jgi:hypothetical protein
MQFAAIIAIGGDLRQAVTQNGAFADCDIRDRRHVRWGNEIDHLFGDVDIFAHEGRGGTDGLARRVISDFPGVLLPSIRAGSIMAAIVPWVMPMPLSPTATKTFVPPGFRPI